MSRPVPSPRDQDVERTFGPTDRQVVARVTAPVLWAAIGVALVAAGSVDVSADQVVALPLAALVVQLLLLPVHRRQGITVSPQGVVVRRGFGTTRKAWADVVAVEQKRVLGVSGLQLRTAYGSLAVPYPASGWLGRDAEFAAKADGVRQWWAAGSR